ncbi:hypothetical protein NHQ30_008909 [Ciborinia camelliae]|nr:hypothetical protein NHQ30_008909 [Ciborinia camelliae]
MIIPKDIAVAAWKSFLLGSGIAIFAALGGIGTKLASASCSSAMWLALFGGPAAAGPVSACIAAGALAVVGAAVSGGLATYGYNAGWTVLPNDAVGSTIGGKRGSYARIINPKFGIAHVFDPHNTLALNTKYGGMLERHNTTLISVSWIETLEGVNYTGSAFNGLNMTHGRVITLNDNGIIRTSVGGIETLPRILDDFADFKNNVTSLKKRQSEEVDYMSYIEYGENFQEAGAYIEGIDEDGNAAKASADYTLDNWVDSFDGEYASAFCLSAGPPGAAQGVDSIVVGEVFVNRIAGVDGNCIAG